MSTRSGGVVVGGRIQERERQMFSRRRQRDDEPCLQSPPKCKVCAKEKRHAYAWQPASTPDGESNEKGEIYPTWWGW